MSAEFRVVIPARFASSRFPGKPLALLAGRPMIEYVLACARASAAAEIIVATDDERIAAGVRVLGARVVMTRSDHVSGTERVAEVAGVLGWPDDAIVVNLQGDAPLTPARSVAQVVQLLHAHPAAAMATLCVPIVTVEDYTSPNVVKVVMDRGGRALYFSRASIPSTAHGGRVGDLPEAWRHLGLYAYRVSELRRLSRSPVCTIEAIEKLEQLRALWLGMEIRIAAAEAAHGPDVDTPEDVARVERCLGVGDRR